MTLNELLIFMNQVYLVWLKQTTLGALKVSSSHKECEIHRFFKYYTAISTSGYSYSTILTETTNSKIFIQFLKQLVNNLKLNEKVKGTEILIVMDNSQVHQSKIVIKDLQLWGVKYLFLPSYSPELAPVELFFGILKQRILRTKTKTLNLQKESGIKEIARELKKISAEIVQKLWKHTHEKYKLLIQSIDDD